MSEQTNIKPTLVVIGNGMVGHKYIEQFVEAGGLDSYEVVTFCEESRLAYDRVHLTEYFAGKSADDLSLVEPGYYDKHGLLVHMNDKAIAIDRVNKTVRSEAGLEISYDKVVLATGSFPFVPPVPGADRDNCFVYRTIEDLEAITAAGKDAKIGTVVGGGLLGLEAAKALKDLGLKTHVVEFAPRLMAVQVDDGGGRMLRRMIEELGVSVHTEKNTQVIEDGEDCKHVMRFADGENLETDIVLFSAGIRPRDELARDADIEIGPRGGILINDQCQTSDPDIYAIGECALFEGMIYGLVAPGYDMARIAAKHLLGESDSSFAGADMSTKLKLMGVDVASIGDAHGSTDECKSCVYVDEPNQVYKKLVISDCGKRLLGGVLVGDAEDFGTLQQMMLNDMDLPEHPESLILPNLSGIEKPALGADALPATATICSCNNVSKGDLCTAIEEGAVSMGDLKDCTQAATSCGGCAALVKNVLDAELTARGVEVNNHVCEHFEYSRQELEHLVRVNKLKTFDDLIAAHGKGQGCDICKPTVASVMATTWNEHVIEPHLAGLQDTNDYFMANMQKDGTYSVVPRVPGGEITPQKLIVLGQVADKYGLYTKITGGQRVDLFGAQVHQLPPIWKELIAAGFESGHAYGKSMRTVKSCVGSTWCRYGVQDSVSMAILLEERYRGIRSPHKFKLAVSGCTRECAEAQSKDIGVIATENGWNLYVAGNGGMKPRHADLFATDLDDKTLIQYIDRFLMFYVRTADRLQRTARWMESLEGGLEYVQEVVINDSLGLNEDLEAQMQMLVDTYECEWKKTVEDENKLKRFRTFVNSDESDNNVVFVQERNQIRPATTEERAELPATTPTEVAA